MEIPKSWTFKNKSVAESFDKHVREQLPWYDLASDLTCHLVKSYVPNNGLMYDLGCSTGNITSRCSDFLTDRSVNCINIDDSKEMESIFCGVGKFENNNLCEFKPEIYDVTVMFLSLMFVPVYRREHLIGQLISKQRIGGALIIVDKFTPASSYLSKTISRMTFLNKIKSGCPTSEIIEKEMSLVGVQRPCSIDLFSKFERWFQVGDFIGWIYCKE